MAPKFKVFRTHIGFDDMIVAAASQKAALEAWGAGAHLFAQGFAEDPVLVKAALGQPGIVLRRQFGTKGDFTAQRSRLHMPTIAPAPAPAPRKRAAPEPHATTGSNASDGRAKRRQDGAAQRNAQRRKQQRLEKQRQARERKEAGQRAAEARRRLQDELAAVMDERKEKLGEIEQRETALAKERRELEQSFETRIVGLRRRLKAG